MYHHFGQRVCDLSLSIPVGRVTTYGILAKAAGGGRQSARSVTGILSKSPYCRTIPFHRIVYSNGKVWINSDHKSDRMQLYEREGIEIDTRGYVINFTDLIYYFD